MKKRRIYASPPPLSLSYKNKELTRRRSKDLSRYRLSQSIAWRLHFPRLVVADVRGYLYTRVSRVHAAFREDKRR